MRFEICALVAAYLSAAVLADEEVTPEQFCAARTNTNVTEEDCLAVTGFAQAFQTYGNDHTWKNYIVTTGSGYQISMVRLTGDKDGVALPAPKGPVLLTACAYYDGRAFLGLNDLGEPVVPVQLQEDGWDVWIANRRGTPYSAGHTTENLRNDDPEKYYDFDAETIAEEDYPQLSRTILETRRTEGAPCLKVTLYSDGHSAMEMALMQTMYPNSSKAWLAQQVNLTPCFLFEPHAVDFVVDEDYVAEGEGPCVDDPESKECRNTWDTKEYRAKLREVKEALTKEQLRDFINKFK